MDPLSIASLGMGAIGGIAQLFGGAKRRRQANRAFQEAQDYGNETLAQIQATPETGLPQQEYNQAQRNIDRNMGGGLRALQNMGSGSAIRGISNLVQASNDATGKLDVQNAMTRLRNIQAKRQAIIGQRNMMNQMKYQQASDLANSASAETGAGLSNTFNALQSGAMIDSMNKDEFGDGGMFQGLFKKKRVGNFDELNSLGANQIGNTMSLPTLRGIRL